MTTSNIACLLSIEIKYASWTSCDINQFCERDRERGDEIIPTLKVQYALGFISQPKQKVIQPVGTLRPWFINRIEKLYENLL